MVRVQEFELAYALVMVILNADTPFPFLHLPFGSPERDVDGFGGVQDFSGGGDVDVINLGVMSVMEAVRLMV